MPRKNFTPKEVHEVLADKYHHGMKMTDLQKKYEVSANVIRSIDKEYGEMFKDKFGAKKGNIPRPTVQEMEAFWGKGTKGLQDLVDSD